MKTRSISRILTIALILSLIATCCGFMFINNNVAYAQENEAAIAKVVWNGEFESAYGDDLATLTASTKIGIDGEEKEISLKIIGLPNNSNKDEKGNYKVGRYHIEARFNEDDTDYASYSTYELVGAHEVYIIRDTSLGKEIESLKDQIVEYEKQIKDLQVEIENLTTKIGDLEGDNHQLQGKVTTLQSSVEDLQQKIDALQKSVNGLGGDNSNLEIQIAELQSANTALKEQITNVQIGLQGKLDTLQGKFDSANSNNLKLQKQVDELQSDISSLTRRVVNQGKSLSGSVAISIVILILLILLVVAVVFGYLIMIGKIKLPKPLEKQEDVPQSTARNVIEELQKVHIEELTQLGRGLGQTLDQIESAEAYIYANYGEAKDIQQSIINIKEELMKTIPDISPKAGEPFNISEMKGDGANRGDFVKETVVKGKKLGKQVIRRAEVEIIKEK